MADTTRELVDLSTRIGGRPALLHALFARTLAGAEHEHAASLLLQLAARLHTWIAPQSPHPPAHGHIGNHSVDRRPIPLTLTGRPEQLSGDLHRFDADRGAELLVAALDRAAHRGELPPFHAAGVGLGAALALRHRPGGASRIELYLPGEPVIAIGALELRRPAVALSAVLSDPARRGPVLAATVAADSVETADLHAASIVASGAAAIERAAEAGIARAVIVARDGGILLYPVAGGPSEIPFLPPA